MPRVQVLRRIRTAAWGLVAGIAVLAVAFVASPALRNALAPRHIEIRGEARVGGSFVLVDQAGRSRSNLDFRGRYVLLMFGCTSCDASTPALVQIISDVLDRLGRKASRFQPVMVTLNPDFDTPDRLADFANRWEPRMTGLTGSTEAITRVAEMFHYRGRISRDAEAENVYILDDSPVIYLIDTEGRFIEQLSQEMNVEDLVRQLSALQ